MFSGELGAGFSYDAGVHSGMFIDPNEDKSKIRDGRQKVSKAKGDDFAYTARVKYTGVPGLELAATAQYQADLWQGESFAGKRDADATLVELHAAYRNGPIGLRALYARWDIDSVIENIKEGADEQRGFYIEPSYQLTDKLGIFTRYSRWDNQAGSSSDTEKSQYDIGFNYWLHEQVVLKADYMREDNNKSGEPEMRGFNLGIGWSF